MKCLIGALLVLSALGCSRKSDNSNVTFSLPERTSKATKVGALAVVSSSATDPVLAHVVLNISGPNMPTIVRNFDSHQGSIPSTLSVDIPKGDNRLFQVLAVYQSPDNNAMMFYYGDITKSLANASETADIFVTSMGGASSPISGHVYGRYFTNATGGPTADVVTMYNPGPGKARMTIERGSMFNGWFSIFGLSSVPLEYEIQPGASEGAPSLMWGGPVTLRSPIFNPDNLSSVDQNRVKRITMPIRVRKQENGGGTYSYELEEASLYVWGYWRSPAAASASLPTAWSSLEACHNTADLGPTLTKMLRFTTTQANWPTQPGLTSTTIAVGASLPTDLELLDPVLALSNFNIQGGTTTCPGSPGDEFSVFLKVTNDLIDGNGNDNAGGFRAPFRVSSTGSPFDITTAGEQKILTGDFLPGVGGNVDEVRIFKKTGLGNDDHGGSDLECPDVARGAMGYIFAGAALVPNDGHVVLTANISTSEVAGGTGAVVCSVRAGKLLAGGVRLGTWAFNSYGGGGGGGSGGPPTQLSLETLGAVNTASMSQCYPVSVNIRDASGYPATLTSAVSVNLSQTGAVDLFPENDPSCVGSPLSLPLVTPSTGGGNYQSYLRFHYKIAGMIAAASTIGLTATDAAATLASSSKTVTVVPQPDVAQMAISNVSFQMLNSVLFDVCVPFQVEAKNSQNFGVNLSGGDTATVTSSVANSLYPDGTCTTGAATSKTLNWTNSPSYFTSYIKVPSAGNSSLTSVNLSVVQASPAGPATGMHMLSLGLPGAAMELGILPLGNVNGNACNSFQISLKDAGGSLANVNAAVNVELNANNGGVFRDGCPGSANISNPYDISIAAGSPSAAVTIYYQAPSNASGFSADLAGGPYLHKDFYVSAAPSMTTVSPTTALTGGAPFYVNGNNFPGGATVSITIGGLACTSPMVLSQNQLMCYAPSNTPSSYPVLVWVNGVDISIPGGPYYVAY